MGWLAPCPGRFTPGKETRYPLYRRLGGPQGRSGRLRKLSPPPGFDPRTVQSVAIRYTDYAIPAHLYVVYTIYIVYTIYCMCMCMYIHIHTNVCSCFFSICVWCTHHCHEVNPTAVNKYHIISFHCTSAVRVTKKSIFTLKATYQWVLHGLVGTFLYKVRCKWEHRRKPSEVEEEVLRSVSILIDLRVG
jgi:hypothetical protein